MILTIPVLLYQLLFVVVLLIASRFGKMALNLALVCCLAWTATHVFLPLLMIVQGAIVIGSYLLFRRRVDGKRGHDISASSSISDE